MENDDIDFSYNKDNDTFVIFGIRYSGELFRSFAASGLDLNTPFEIIKREDGVITIHRLD